MNLPFWFSYQLSRKWGTREHESGDALQMLAVKRPKMEANSLLHILNIPDSDNVLSSDKITLTLYVIHIHFILISFWLFHCFTLGLLKSQDPTRSMNCILISLKPILFFSKISALYTHSYHKWSWCQMPCRMPNFPKSLIILLCSHLAYSFSFIISVSCKLHVEVWLNLGSTL